MNGRLRIHKADVIQTQTPISPGNSGGPLMGESSTLIGVLDKYGPDGPMARLLKFLLLFISMVAIFHRLRPYGLALF